MNSFERTTDYYDWTFEWLECSCEVNTVFGLVSIDGKLNLLWFREEQEALGAVHQDVPIPYILKIDANHNIHGILTAFIWQIPKCS